MIELFHLQGGYPNNPVIDPISLSLPTGQWLSLVGANGSGKSTLLKLINRILTPQGGTVYLDGKAGQRMTRREMAQQMAFLAQQPTVPQGITVQQLVALGRSPHQPWWSWDATKADQEAIELALAQTQLLPLRHRPVVTLSGGERQRAFLALALAQQPRALLLDEPTTYLDIHHQLSLLELLKDLQRQQQITLITVLHDLNLAARYSDRLAFLKQGQLWCEGPVAQVFTPEHIHAAFDLAVEMVETSRGRIMIPLAAATPACSPVPSSP
ncbi:ABC transporter ATP-binding protein [Lyngbya confervoides]|uniref:ABC transporter ATP-binding protein n=1 Tax=Lyngbya confervoides BDU141951 TaxID=1574623 RepID=A0ABD4T3M4_9CYAN|nr:ABC transporter ATP-binding protein [Lyngbya confervoides]MCM1982915.1 ABC transporter ATP-binding protein [Lyngbya confervoides BDU141951]